MMGQLGGAIFFSLVAIVIPVAILKLKKPEQIFLSSAIIAAPWSGGVWIGFIKLDFRLTYIFFLIAMALSGSKKLGLTKKSSINLSVILPATLFLFWASVSAIQAYDMNIALKGVVSFLLNLLVLITLVRNINRMKDIEYLLKSLFIGLFITSVIALVQYQIRGFHIGFVDGEYSTFLFWRPRSTFEHTNQYGMYQMFVLPILFRQIIIEFRNKRKQLVNLYILLFLLSAFTLYTTSNRGSWVGFTFGMASVIGIEFFRSGSKKTRKIMIRIMVPILLILALASIKYGPRVYDRFFGESYGRNAESQMQGRKKLNEDAYRIIKEYPTTGVGIYNFNYYLSSFIFTHNIYLLATAETGYPGLIFFIWYILGFLLQGKRLLFNKNFYTSNMGAGFVSVVLGFLLASYVGPDYWISNKVSLVFWIIAGITIGGNKVYYIARRRQRLQKLQSRLTT